MKKKLLVAVMLLGGMSLVTHAQNQSDGGVTPANPISPNTFTGEVFRFKPGLVTHLLNGDLPYTTGGVGFTTSDRWLSFGQVNAGSQTIYGYRTQTNGRGLAWGHSVPTGGSVSDPFIEWIGNQTVAGVDPGNLNFRFGLNPGSPGSPAINTTIFTMEPNVQYGTFGNSYAKNGLLGHSVIGKFGDISTGNAQWIGIGQPYNISTGNPITSIYGLRTQWGYQALNLALRNNGSFLSDALLEWGNQNIASSSFTIRNIINQTPIGPPVLNTDYYNYMQFEPKGFRVIVGQNTNNSLGEARFAVYDGVNPTPASTPPIFSTGAVYGLSDGVGFPSNTPLDYAAGVVGDVYNAQSNLGSYGVLGIGGNNFGGRWAGYFIGRTYSSGGYSSSDAKLKKDIKQEEGMLAKLMKLKPSQYFFNAEKYKTMNLETALQHGFIAQELEEVFPEMVTTVNAPSPVDAKTKKAIDPFSFKAVNYTQLHAVEVAAIQELQAEIDELKKQLASKSNEVVVINENSAAAIKLKESSFMLAQNVPNPFTSSTTIKYSIPAKTTAMIGIFDLNGRMLLQYPNLTGSAQITINGSTLQAGMYLYSLIVNGEEIVTKKMVLTK